MGVILKLKLAGTGTARPRRTRSRASVGDSGTPGAAGAARRTEAVSRPVHRTMTEVRKCGSGFSRHRPVTSLAPFATESSVSTTALCRFARAARSAGTSRAAACTA